MTPAEFKTKWARFQGKESSAYQGHFDDLCRLLGLLTPAEADPTGSDFFCFQKRVVKDVELFELTDLGEETTPEERGFADVWKKGCFAWEYAEAESSAPIHSHEGTSQARGTRHLDCCFLGYAVPDQYGIIGLRPAFTRGTLWGFA